MVEAQWTFVIIVSRGNSLDRSVGDKGFCVRTGEVPLKSKDLDMENQSRGEIVADRPIFDRDQEHVSFVVLLTFVRFQFSFFL